MAIKITFEGTELNERVCESVQFLSTTDDDSNARATDLWNTIVLKGRILTDADAEEAVIKLAEWSNIRAEDSKCYKELEVNITNSSRKIRNYKFPHCFIVNFKESFGDSEGVGTFSCTFRQKKDRLDDVNVWSE